MSLKVRVQKALSAAGWLAYLDAQAFGALLEYVEAAGGGLEAVHDVLSRLNDGARAAARCSVPRRGAAAGCRRRRRPSAPGARCAAAGGRSCRRTPQRGSSAA